MKAVATFYPDQATTWPTQEAAHNHMMTLEVQGFKFKLTQVPGPWRIDVIDGTDKVVAYIKEDTTQ